MNTRLFDGPELGAPKGSLVSRAFRVLGAGLLGAVLVTAGGLMVHEVVTGADWEVHRIEITGNTHASDAALRHLADVRPGQHLATVDLQRAVEGVIQHPWVRRAEARRIFPGTISLVVEEHDPKLLLALDELWYVDSSGQPFKRVRSGSMDYPVLTGLDPQLAEEHPQVARAILRRALDILEVTAGHSLAGPGNLSELRFSRRTGFTLVLRNGTELVVGFDRPDEHLQRLDRLLAAGLDPSVPQRIDLDAGNVAIATPLGNPGSGLHGPVPDPNTSPAAAPAAAPPTEGGQPA